MDPCQMVVGSAPPPPPATDRPMVFVAEPLTVGTPLMRGLWLDPTQRYADLRGQLAGASMHYGFVIVDQVGFGRIMVDEDLDLAELRVLALTVLAFGRAA